MAFTFFLFVMVFLFSFGTQLITQFSSENQTHLNNAYIFCVVVFNHDMFYNFIVEHQVNEETKTETLEETRKYYFGWRFALDFISNCFFYFEVLYQKELKIVRDTFIKLITKIDLEKLKQKNLNERKNIQFQIFSKFEDEISQYQYHFHMMTLLLSLAYLKLIFSQRYVYRILKLKNDFHDFMKYKLKANKIARNMYSLFFIILTMYMILHFKSCWWMFISNQKQFHHFQIMQHEFKIDEEQLKEIKKMKNLNIDFIKNIQ